MTLRVPPDLERRLKAYSAHQGKTEQQALEELLNSVLPDKFAAPRHAWVGIGQSDVTDLSERVDELLFADEQLGER